MTAKEGYKAGYIECELKWRKIIEAKIAQLEEKRKKYYNKELSKAQHDKSMKMWGAICYLKELLERRRI